MAQNDTHVALIILTTQMWGGGVIGGKKFFGPKFCVPAPSAPTSVLTQNKGPDTEPHFSNPPPPLRRASMSPPPPPPPQSNFQVAQAPRAASRRVPLAGPDMAATNSVTASPQDSGAAPLVRTQKPGSWCSMLSSIFSFQSSKTRTASSSIIDPFKPSDRNCARNSSLSSAKKSKFLSSW